ncbi:MAG: NAD(P)/FAD-dependent oxidoreductase [Anaerolineae bacterium]
MTKHVIVGSGVAGMTAALNLTRYEDTDIVLYTKDQHSYYYRPEVTNYLAGQKSLEDICRRPVSWYEKRGIEMHLDTCVTRVLPTQKEIVLEDETHVSYDRLLLAPGSRPFIPPIEGVKQTGVFTIRTLSDAQAIRQYVAEAQCKHAVVIGGGLLGLEGARGLKGMGLDVTIVELLPRLMPLQLDEEGGAVLRDFVEQQGYHVRLGTSARQIQGDAHVTGVLLNSEERLHADIVIIATGVRSNTYLAEEAGLDVDRGIVVNRRMQTSAPDVFAAGDAARCMGQSWAIVPPAQAQGQVAAANMAGHEALYEPVTPATSLKVVGIDVDSIGEVHPEEGAGFTELRHVEAETHRYTKIVLKDEKPVGAIVIGHAALAKELDDRIKAGEPMTSEEARTLLTQ